MGVEALCGVANHSHACARGALQAAGAVDEGRAVAPHAAVSRAAADDASGQPSAAPERGVAS